LDRDQRVEYIVTLKERLQDFDSAHRVDINVSHDQNPFMLEKVEEIFADICDEHFEVVEVETGLSGICHCEKHCKTFNFQVDLGIHMIK